MNGANQFETIGIIVQRDNPVNPFVSLDRPRRETLPEIFIVIGDVRPPELLHGKTPACAPMVGAATPLC
jgi:hypothetical protein